VNTVCLQFGKERDARHATLIVSGEIDLVNARRIDPEEILRGLDRGAVVNLDLTGVSYMDSTGISRLILLARAAKARGISVACSVRCGSTLHKAMRLIGLQDVLTIVPSRDEPASPADRPVI